MITETSANIKRNCARYGENVKWTLNISLFERIASITKMKEISTKDSMLRELLRELRQ